MSSNDRRRIAALVVAVLAVALLAFPVFAASPSPTGSPSAGAKSHGSGNGKANANAHAHPNAHANPNGKPDASHEPETPVTLHGSIARASDADGDARYTLSVDGATYDLSVGPPWFWGDRNPLEAYVGKTVTVVGEREGSGAEVDVESVDGKTIREPGKPPWAGGPKAVGSAHPGYDAWKAAHDRAAESAAP